MNSTLVYQVNQISFDFEEEAYHRLKKYLEDLREQFVHAKGDPEIMADIEARIAEVLQQKLGSGRKVILLEDVEAVISSIGQPDELNDGKTSAQHIPLTLYAGFWRRFAAFFIDYALVSILVFPLILLMGFLRPDNVVVKAPLGLFTQSRVLSSEKSEEKNADGSVTAVETRKIEETVLGKWTYLYEERIERLAGKEEKKKQLLDPVTKTPVERTGSENITLLVLMIYWVLMEASKIQGSVGKRALGIMVFDSEGRRPTLLRALARNLLKILSLFTLTIGFMMAGWTQRKQALHDLIAKCLLTEDGCFRIVRFGAHN